MNEIMLHQEMEKLIIVTKSEKETHFLGVKMAQALRPGMTVLLRGDLGSGKTTLVRGIAEGLGAKNVRSPSFTLVNEYDARIPIVHVDLYRLPEGSGDSLGLEEYLLLGSLLLVEWPERWSSPPLDNLWVVSFSMVDDVSENPRSLPGETRHVVVEGLDKEASEVLRQMDLDSLARS